MQSAYVLVYITDGFSQSPILMGYWIIYFILFQDSNEALESGEKMYFPALNVGVDKPSAVVCSACVSGYRSSWIWNADQTKTQRHPNLYASFFFWLLLLLLLLINLNRWLSATNDHAIMWCIFIPKAKRFTCKFINTFLLCVCVFSNHIESYKMNAVLLFKHNSLAIFVFSCVNTCDLEHFSLFLTENWNVANVMTSWLNNYWPHEYTFFIRLNGQNF